MNLSEWFKKCIYPYRTLLRNVGIVTLVAGTIGGVIGGLIVCLALPSH